QDRFDQNDVIRLTFNENMAATADDVGQTFELTDTDGDRFTLICGAAVNCVLGGDLRTLTLTLNTTPTDANAGGNGVLNIPATITAVSGGLDDATGTQLDLAASTDRLVDKAAKACTITGAGMITGTAGDDVICGSPGADRIAGLGGNDTIYALDGDDQVTGGDGNDQVFGGLGSDQLLGGNGDDTLSGDGGGVDRLAGEAGDDNLVVVDGTSNDAAAGGAHVTGDTCTVDPGDAVAQCEQVTTA
ncbi:MAG: hypothetical protein Q8K63_00545, partial [Acidimicrobiales bacterium]|nr:hypothetical protein [Acidimicrobiales bacterium]